MCLTLLIAIQARTVMNEAERGLISAQANLVISGRTSTTNFMTILKAATSGGRFAFDYELFSCIILLWDHHVLVLDRKNFDGSRFKDEVL